MEAARANRSIMTIEIPDSATAQAAAGLAREAAPAFLLNHSYRTFLF